MIDRSGFQATSEAIADWLEGDKCWQKRSDHSHDGDLPEKVRLLARAQRDRRRDELRGQVLSAVMKKQLKIFLLPMLALASSEEGTKIRQVIDYLLANPADQRLGSKTITRKMGLKPGEIDRKTVDRAKDQFYRSQRWTTASATELPNIYLEASQFPAALYSGDARRLALKTVDHKATDGTLYFERQAWNRWRSSI